MFETQLQASEVGNLGGSAAALLGSRVGTTSEFASLLGQSFRIVRSRIAWNLKFVILFVFESQLQLQAFEIGNFEDVVLISKVFAFALLRNRNPSLCQF